MREGSSGLLFSQQKDGSVMIEVVDYGVEEFGGRDWESRYDLDKENANKLFEKLCVSHSGTFEDMLIAEFGKNFEIFNFERFCRDNDIKFSHMTWC